MLILNAPYVLFLGAVDSAAQAKTAFGLRDWAREKCLSEYALPGCTIELGLPRYALAEARARGARSLLIGVANYGGYIDPAWLPTLLEALALGLDVVAGLHARLNQIPALTAAAAVSGARLLDVRHSAEPIALATGQPRSGHRVLTVGSDCAIGKKYAALALTQALRERGLRARFRATGQTGILLAGEGIAVDAVAADFISGAAEQLSPAADPAQIDVIEGQGSIVHPIYAGVTLGLLHGAQAHQLVLCHEPSRTAIRGYERYPIPPLSSLIALYESLAQRTNPAARVSALSLNTATLDDATARHTIAALSAELGLPAADPIRYGAAPLAAAIAAAATKYSTLVP
jgi:uncharacterized NAD-dependent epimerase/dehydratase family protein